MTCTSTYVPVAQYIPARQTPLTAVKHSPTNTARILYCTTTSQSVDRASRGEAWRLVVACRKSTSCLSACGSPRPTSCEYDTYTWYTEVLAFGIRNIYGQGKYDPAQYDTRKHQYLQRNVEHLPEDSSTSSNSIDTRQSLMY